MRNFFKRFKRMNAVKIIFLLGIALILVGGFSFAYLNFAIQGEETNLVKAGCLKIDFTEQNNINLINTQPLTDSAGKNSNPYIYTITNSCSIEAYYEATLNVLNTSGIGNESKVNVYMTGDNYIDITSVDTLRSVVLDNAPANIRNSYLLDSGYLAVGESKNFNLRMWIDYDVTTFDGSFNTKVIVTSVADDSPVFSSNTTGNQILARNGVTNPTVVNPNFSYVAPNLNDSQTSGLFKAKGQDNNPTYYFRGQINNNYIVYGKYASNTSVTYKNSSNQNVTIIHDAGEDILWRIVRINEDGSLKLVLDDFSSVSKFNNEVNSASYTGYAYDKADSETSSNIKTNIDNWYNTHLRTNYDDYIINTNFCVDKEYIEQSGNFIFNALTRNVTNNKPIIKCELNNILTSKIGLLSADEIAMAGNVYNTANINNYLYKNSSGWWSLSPAKYESNIGYNINYGTSSLNFSRLDTELAVRPVISIASNLVLGGSGTLENPYTVESVRKDTHLLTINPNGGTYKTISTTITHKLVEDDQITLDIPIKNSYAFAGWEVNGNQTYQTNSLVQMGEENISLKAMWVKQIVNFSSSGSYELFDVIATGYYKMELWGAQGGSYNDDNSGGKGSYSSGIVYLTAGEKLYVYAGGIGGANNDSTNVGGYNGGGFSGTHDASYSMGGGGATDVRCFYNSSTRKCVSNSDNLVWDNYLGLNSRIIVAGGGGGSLTIISSGLTRTGATGGKLYGLEGLAFAGARFEEETYLAAGGSQTEAGTSYQLARSGGFGYGIQTNTSGYGGGGGAGYYGGATGYGRSGASGSSFISGYAGVNAISAATNQNNPRTNHSNNVLHYSNKYFINGIMESDSNIGAGRAKISWMGVEPPTKINTKLNSVRYIKNCQNGNTTNTNNYLVEIQAIVDGNNIAFGKPVTGLSNNASYVTDGLTATNQYASGGTCAIVDLRPTGGTYNLDEIAVWNYWGDGRTSFDNIISVSATGLDGSWLEVMNYTEPETNNGKRVSAYENEKTRYNLTVILSGGSYGRITTTQTYNLYQGQTITLLDPIRENYVFAGWNVNGIGSLINENQFTMGNSNSSVTATWIYQPQITINPNGGTYGETTANTLIRVTPNSTTTLLIPTRVNYTFAGWTITGTGGSTTGDNVTVTTNDIVAKAKWKLTTTSFAYTGQAPTTAYSAIPGTYILKVWGASGGAVNSATETEPGGTAIGGKGGISTGTLTVTSTASLYVYVGGVGTAGNTTAGVKSGGFNGGGSGYSTATYAHSGGGGATDIRRDGTAYANRIIIAGGGGGAGCYTIASGICYAGGSGGGVAGNDGSQRNTNYLAGTGGSTTKGISYYGTTADSTTYGSLAAIGIGGSQKGTYRISGGGGGYYGGGYSFISGAGGGSGYIGGVTGGSMTTGGWTGNGKATITVVSLVY